MAKTTSPTSIRLLFAQSAVSDGVESGQNLGFGTAIDDEGLLFKFTAHQPASEPPLHVSKAVRIDDMREVSELRIVSEDGEPVNEKHWLEWGYAPDRANF